jgi:hypothetical protein
MHRLKQEKFPETRTIILHEDRVELIVNNRKFENSTFFKYEDILTGKKFSSSKSQPNYGLYVISRNTTIVLFFLKIFGVIESWSSVLALLCSTIIMFLIHAFTFKTYVELETNSDEELVLIKDNPDESKFEKFIETLYKNRKEYLKKTYYSNNKHINEETLHWLLDQNIITQHEYDIRIDFL